eukprot:760563-Hanusia_phi.AAC.2
MDDLARVSAERKELLRSAACQGVGWLTARRQAGRGAERTLLPVHVTAFGRGDAGRVKATEGRPDEE